MGTGWRRFTEGVRQNTVLGSVGKYEFVSTSTARTNTMLWETKRFADCLNHLEKQLRAMHCSALSALEAAMEVAAQPVPRTYEEALTGGGGMSPMAASQGDTIGGPEFDFEGMKRVADDLQTRMEAEVIAPLKRWQAAHRSIVDQSRELEKIRLELDSRRRTAAELAAKVETQREKAAAGAVKGQAQLTAQLGALVGKLQQKQQKVAVSAAAFQQAEGELAQQLVMLIRDAAWLRNFLAASFLIQGGSLTEAALASGLDVEDDAGQGVGRAGRMGGVGVRPGTYSATVHTPGAFDRVGTSHHWASTEQEGLHFRKLSLA